METWVKNKCKKDAIVVTNHLPDWMSKIHGDKDLSSLLAEEQRIAKATKWECMTPLNQEEVDAQAILDMDVQSLEGCADVTLNSNRSTFVAAEDDWSICTFKTFVHNTANDDNHNSFAEGSENEKNDNNHTPPYLTHPPNDNTKDYTDK